MICLELVQASIKKTNHQWPKKTTEQWKNPGWLDDKRGLYYPGFIGIINIPAIIRIPMKTKHQVEDVRSHHDQGHGIGFKT